MLVSRVPNSSTCTRCAVVGDRVQEVQQHPRVAIHRAGDVAQHDERRRAPARARDTRAARAAPAAPVMPPQRRAQIDRDGRARAATRAPHRRLRAAAACRRASMRLAPRASSSAVIVAKSLRLQDLARRERERRVELDLVVVVRRGVGACGRQHRLREARRQLRRRSRSPRARRAPSAAAPRSSSRAAWDCARRGRTPARTAALLVPRHEHRRQRRVEIVAVGRRRPPRPRRARRAPWPGRPASPRARSTRTKCSDVLGEAALAATVSAARSTRRHASVTAAMPSACTSATSRAADLRRERADVVLVLEQHAERVGDRLRVERDAVERDQRLGPVERLGDAGRLEEIQRAQPLRERDDLARQRLRRARTLAAHDRELALRVGIVDPVIEAAALDRVVDLARAVRRDDDDRRRRRRGSGRARESSPGTRPAPRADRPRTARRCDRARRSAAPARCRRRARAPAAAAASAGSAA